MDAQGRVDPHTEVQILATPPLSPGQKSYRTRLVGRAWMSPDGTVQFPRVAARPLRRYADRGTLNVEVFASASGQTAMWAYALDLPRAGRVSLAPTPEDLKSPGAQPTTSVTTAQLDAPDRTLTLAPTPHQRLDGSGSTTAARAAAGRCVGGTQRVATYFPWVKMGIARSDRKKASAKFTLHTGQETSLGVAFSTSAGGTRFAGRTSQSSTWEDTWRRVRKRAVQYETTWEYGKFRHRVCDRGRQRVLYTTYETRPVQHRGDMRFRRPGRYKAPFCIRTAPTQESTVTQLRAVEWSNGVQLEAKGFAMDLTSQTGYSTSARMDFAWKKRGRLCGQFTTPRAVEGQMIGSLIAR